jgi:hypothetical protein
MGPLVWIFRREKAEAANDAAQPGPFVSVGVFEIRIEDIFKPE